MPAYSGKFQYLDEAGATLQQGPCQVSIGEDGACIVTPAGGTPLAFDLGDVDRIAPGEWDLQLFLYTGRTLVLQQFGAAFSHLAGDLLAAWRDRTVQCLLLEDMQEIDRYTGAANGVPAELRLFRSNLAILPQSGMPLQWRLAELDSCDFDDGAYSIVLESGGERLVLSKLARKTDEAFGKLRTATEALHTHTASALRGLFPFLNADALQRLQQAMPEGRSCAISTLAAIHPGLPEAMHGKAVGETLAPYLEELAARAVAPPFVGFKFTAGLDPDAEGESDDAAEGAVESTPENAGEGEGPQIFFWYFYPLRNNLVAWEATTGTGRATYFFRYQGPLDAAIARITRGLALVNFRREPVYLPDASLQQQPRYARYAIGARKLPDLRALRGAYAGRAIHSSLENWKAQVDSATV
ncbi:MAG: hypothetical protein ABI759_01215 [Candidatus Solibacter sp.]